MNRAPRPAPTRRQDSLKYQRKYIPVTKGRHGKSRQIASREVPFPASARIPKSDACPHEFAVDSSLMKALMISQFAGPQALEIRETGDPQPGADEVVVKVEAVGLNFADLLTASGGYPGLPKPPFIAGREFAGVIEETGKRVMGYIQWGGFAQRVAARKNLLWPVPASFSIIEAAAFPVNYFTAYFAYWKAGLVPESAAQGARVLIHAAAGGVGTAAVEIGTLLGIEDFGTSSSSEKLSKLKSLGLRHAINYKEEDYEEAIKRLTQDEGVDAVFEMLGGEHVEKSVRCLRNFGRVITYGAATGKPAHLDPRVLYARGTSVHGLWLSQLSKNPEVMANAWNDLSTWLREGKLHPAVGHVLSLERHQEAYGLLREGKNYGKVVMTI
jgi:NADPH2:quinone reductase